MENKELVNVDFAGIEKEMQKYNPDFRHLTVEEIASDPKRYQIYSSPLDDHFTILLRSADKDAVKKARDYLKKEGFSVLGSQDIYGLNKVRQQYIFEGKFPMADIEQTIKKTAEYLNVDLSKNEDIGTNKEGDYFFYFFPIKDGVSTWVKFKEGIYLDKLNEFAKASHQSIDLIFSQLDNVVYGGLKLPGIASEEYYQAFFEAVNVQVSKKDKRTLFIACRNLMELVDKEEELDSLGLFQMFLVDDSIFYEEHIEEIYLDFPNEVDENVFEKL